MEYIYSDRTLGLLPYMPTPLNKYTVIKFEISYKLKFQLNKPIIEDLSVTQLAVYNHPRSLPIFSIKSFIHKFLRRTKWLYGW